MLDHLSIQCADIAVSTAFYDAVLAPLGGQRVMDFGDADRLRGTAQAGVLDRPPGHR
jgi:catechol 2,3-dioxygenase-like lactoylglutathione lyase family enzyme